MSRVFRALERAEKEKQGKLPEKPFLGIFGGESIAPKDEVPVNNLKLGPERLEVSVGEEIVISIAPPHSYAEEQFRKLKTQIFRRSPRPPRCILITSSFPQEGKSTIAVNLAMSISQEIHKKVILIDADLRKPSIYTDKYSNSKGLSDYLSGQKTISEILTNFESENFMIIPAGIPSQKPAELIGSGRMKDLLKNLREFGEDTFVLIDSPPVLTTSEPLLLSEWVDGVILVVLAGRIPKGAVRRVVDSIGREKIIGVVFNQKDLKPIKHYYDHYYRNYRK
jgi:capsular exopolysaccharide synthesis family protein